MVLLKKFEKILISIPNSPKTLKNKNNKQVNKSTNKKKINKEKFCTKKFTSIRSDMAKASAKAENFDSSISSAISNLDALSDDAQIWGCWLVSKQINDVDKEELKYWCVKIHCKDLLDLSLEEQNGNYLVRLQEDTIEFYFEASLSLFLLFSHEHPINYIPRIMTKKKKKSKHLATDSELKKFLEKEWKIENVVAPEHPKNFLNFNRGKEWEIRLTDIDKHPRVIKNFLRTWKTKQQQQQQQQSAADSPSVSRSQEFASELFTFIVGKELSFTPFFFFFFFFGVMNDDN
ncbi:hypothetical protein RFI_30601, partial [Reticulomyxa filosa]